MLDDICSQPFGVAVAQVASRDSHLLPEQAQLELDLDGPRETGWNGGCHRGHGERDCGRMGLVGGSFQEEREKSSRLLDSKLFIGRGHDVQ